MEQEGDTDGATATSAAAAMAAEGSGLARGRKAGQAAAPDAVLNAPERVEPPAVIRLRLVPELRSGAGTDTRRGASADDAAAQRHLPRALPDRVGLRTPG